MGLGAPGVPPEVVFDRYFQNGIPREARRFKGKADLDRLRGSVLPANILEDVQQILNQALLNARPDSAHAAHGILHFDYIDSDDRNAVAFSSGGYAFIGITIGLLNNLWDINSRLSQSADVAAILHLSDAADRSQVLAQLFRLQLFFIVGHEWSHHVFGHAAALDSSPASSEHEARFMDEIRTTGAAGSLVRQTNEVVADGYSAYYTLGNLVTGDERPKALDLLRADPNADDHRKDLILLNCFITAITGFMFARPPLEVTAATARGLTHPPQALRLRLLLMSSSLWATSYRANLTPEISPENFRPLFRAVASATWGMNGGVDWSAQIAFLLTPEGDRYAQGLISSRNAAVTAMGLNSPDRGAAGETGQ